MTGAHLKNVVSRFDVCDVDPLAVDVVAVQIPAAHSDALIAKVGTLVALRNTWVEKTFVDFLNLRSISFSLRISTSTPTFREKYCTYYYNYMPDLSTSYGIN